MQNDQLLKELMTVLGDMDYFAIHPSSRLRKYLRQASTQGDQIRLILRDPDVQEYVFPDWATVKQTVHDPISYYVDLRRSGVIPPR